MAQLYHSCKTKKMIHCLLLLNKIHLQMINTRRQTLFEIKAKKSNPLSCLNRKLQLDFKNLPIEAYKIKCKSILVVSCFKNFISLYILCSFYNDV